MVSIPGDSRSRGHVRSIRGLRQGLLVAFEKTGVAPEDDGAKSRSDVAGGLEFGCGFSKISRIAGNVDAAAVQNDPGRCNVLGRCPFPVELAGPNVKAGEPGFYDEVDKGFKAFGEGCDWAVIVVGGGVALPPAFGHRPVQLLGNEIGTHERDGLHCLSLVSATTKDRGGGLGKPRTRRWPRGLRRGRQIGHAETPVDVLGFERRVKCDDPGVRSRHGEGVAAISELSDRISCRHLVAANLDDVDLRVIGGPACAASPPQAPAPRAASWRIILILAAAVTACNHTQVLSIRHTKYTAHDG